MSDEPTMEQIEPLVQQILAKAREVGIEVLTPKVVLDPSTSSAFDLRQDLSDVADAPRSGTFRVVYGLSSAEVLRLTGFADHEYAEDIEMILACDCLLVAPPGYLSEEGGGIHESPLVVFDWQDEPVPAESPD